MGRPLWTPLRCSPSIPAAPSHASSLGTWCLLQGSSGPSPAAWGSCCRFGGAAVYGCLTCCLCCGPCPTRDCGSCCGLSSTVTPSWRPRSSGTRHAPPLPQTQFWGRCWGVILGHGRGP